MRFRFVHRIDAPVAAVERVLLHPDFATWAAEAMRLVASVEPIARREEDGRILRVARYVPRPGAIEVPRFVEPAWLCWEERVRWSPEEHRGEFEIRPELPDWLRHRVQVGGSYALVRVDGGCERVVEGQLVVKAPLIGAALERTSLGLLEGSFEDEAQLLRERGV